MMCNFEGHLHTHTEFSFLDGMAKIEELILRAKELGQTGIAITDHGGSSGLYEAWKLGKKHDFNVLLGEEFYFDNEVEDLRTGHIILIAKNEEGLSNIFKLQRLAYDNFYYKPRITLDMLKDFSSGLVCTTACIANQIGQLILKNENQLALRHILELNSIFKEDFYIELQSTTNEEVECVNLKLQEFIEEYDFKCVMTTDIHYVLKEDYELHEVLLAIQQQKKMSDKKRWRFENNDYFLKSEEEMLKDLNGINEQIIRKCFLNISEIFEKCKGVNFVPGNYLPKFSETKEEEDNALRLMVMKGYRNKVMQKGEATDTFAKDLEKELAVIADTGYSGYFLIVQEYIAWARKNGILVGDGRGSGAGSKVAYTIDITEVNPEKHDLLFERFLTPGRQPDFDVDFSDIDAVFKHLQERYGEENVARVGAYTKFTCKSALRKVMSAFGFSQAEIAVVIGWMPKVVSFTLQEAMDYSKDLTEWLNTHSDIFHIVSRFENMVEHQSTHAGGVIICDGLTGMLPVMTNSEDRSKLIVVMDKEELESLGHYKFDILGLKSLILLKNILEYTGIIDKTDMDFEDKNIYDMLCSGDVMGVFQLSDQREKVMEQQPRCFEDLIAINALIRPGVCDWNEYLKKREIGEDDETLPFMKCTHDLIVYQDQYLQLAQHYAGWDIAFSDKKIRKNKKILEDTELADKWMEDTAKRGYTPEEMKDLWDEICEIVAGGYGFNRAHSTSYAMLSFQTAYMKYYYPKEFYAALLTQNNDNTEKTVEIINAVKNKGIKLLLPDINKSENKYVPMEDGIMLPLNSIKGVGGSVLYEINRLKPIESFQDFLDRRIKKFIKRTSIEALIKAGAFDFCEKTRFEMLSEFNPDTYIKEETRHIYEKQAFGFYINENPFEKYSLKPWSSYSDGDNVITVVEITEITIRYDRKGNEMAFISGVNNHDTLRMVVFSSIWKRMNVTEGEIVLVKGRRDKQSLIVNTMEVLDGTAA